MRVNPSNMLISRDDFAYSHTDGNKIKYGTAGDCYSKSKEDCRKGEFRINLSHTGMKITDIPTWIAAGSPQNMKERITQYKASKDWKFISAHCGGSCSKCEPKDGHLRVQPDICVLEEKKELTATETVLEKRDGRDKASLWSWWPW